MKRRIFIVGPGEAGEHYGDTLYQVCTTDNHRNSFFDIYQNDDYEEYDSTCRLESAILIAKKLGAKRPKVI